ncbi:MAG: AmpG family muropeptide MFS transporter [Bdellovibrionaceae bacterium]|nr:AmpG family muropeptide MFS transporter [Pseudobdellovibrionaceae bacterium]
MTSSPHPKKSFIKELFSQKMLVCLLLGFSSGLPFLLTGGTLKLWLAEAKVDITTIGYFSWVGMMYSLKFLWAPLLDSITLFKLGRRKFWMFFSQIVLMGLIFLLGQFKPEESLMIMALISLLIAFFSATQDVAIDAFRREYLEENELGIGSTMNMYGYRLAMLFSGGLAVALADYLNWEKVYLIMALSMVVGLVASSLAPEPLVEFRPKNFKESVVGPFREFLSRHGAAVILVFVFLFKLGDALSGSMLNPFYKDMGYEKTDIGLIAKTFGLASSMVGLFLGGLIIYYVGIFRSLWFFGILQALSTASFALITYTGPMKWSLAFAVIFEDVSSGMGSAAFVAYMASITNKTFTATQYAILSSVATLGRNFFSGFAGHMVKQLGWVLFFYVCAVIAIPGLVFLLIIEKMNSKKSS